MPPRFEPDESYGDYEILPENEYGISLERIPRQILDSRPAWFRRPKMINRNMHPNHYYRLAILDDFTSVLSEDFNNVELSYMFQEGPFGLFLGWSLGKNNRKLLNVVISRCIFKEQGIWFHIRGQDVEYTLEDYALITGLSFGTTESDLRIARNPTDSSLFQSVCGGLNESANTLCSVFKDKHLNGEVRVKLANLLTANCFVLGHDAVKTVYPWLWELVNDTDIFNSFPWGAYSYKTLIYYLRTFRRTGQKYHIYGPSWALVIWAFEVMPGLGDSFGLQVSTDDVPRCLRWNFVNTFRGVSDVELYTQFDDDDLEISMIMPEGQEFRQEYYLSVHQLDALVVKYHVPSNSYIRVDDPQRIMSLRMALKISFGIAHRDGVPVLRDLSGTYLIMVLQPVGLVSNHTLGIFSEKVLPVGLPAKMGFRRACLGISFSVSYRRGSVMKMRR